jgi:hypothetical protein
MEKKRFHLGKALSSTFQLIGKFPKYILLPLFVQVVFTFTYLYLTYNVSIFRAATRAQRLVIPISSHATLIKNLFSYSYLLILLWLAFIILSGYIRIVKKWLDEKIEPEWKDFFTWDFSLLVKYIALSLIIVIMVWFGFFLLIVPAFVILTINVFAPYVLIDQRTSVGKALNRSADLANGIKGPLFWTILLYGFFVMGPSFYLSWNYYSNNRTDFVLYIYLFSLFTVIAGHISQLTMAHLYQDLSTQQDEIDNKLSNGDDSNNQASPI